MTDKRKVFVGFAGDTLLVRGALEDVARRCRAQLLAPAPGRVVIYDDATGHIFELDLSGSEAEVLARIAHETGDQASGEGASAAAKRSGPGRPKLGVVSREVSLLPRHWQWLAEQRLGASAALRRLVEAAIKNESEDAVARHAIDAAHRFMWDIAGDKPNFEEASRALFAADFDRFHVLIAGWPEGVADQLARFTTRAQGAQRPSAG